MSILDSPVVRASRLSSLRSIVTTVLSVATALSVAPGLLHAQEVTSAHSETVLGVVDTIIVSGNEKTKTYVILDEMTLKPGSVVTTEAIHFDRGRIYSLGLFTSVDILFDSLGTQTFLLVDVRERWYIIPIPILGFRDGDAKRVYYGGGLLNTNFRGRNQKLYGSVVFGFDPAVSFSFSDPLFDRERNLYFGVSASTASVRNRSIIESSLTGDFDERHYDVSGTVGKRFTLFETIGFNLGAHFVRVSSYRQGRTASPDGTDVYMYGSVSYTNDTRDLREYATRGTLLNVYVVKNGFGEGDVAFSRFGIDARKFIPLGGDFSLATRAFTSVVSGSSIPTYARVYFGAGERIRGYYSTIWEGENMAGGVVELRYTLFNTRTFLFSALPLPPEFAIWRFGVSLALFTDNGLAWFRGDRLTFGAFASGYGVGIHFLLPYGLVLRTEYAWNEYGEGQFIFDLQTSI